MRVYGVQGEAVLPAHSGVLGSLGWWRVPEPPMAVAKTETHKQMDSSLYAQAPSSRPWRG